MAKFHGILPSFSAISIDNGGGGCDGWQGGVGWDNKGGRWQKTPFVTPHEQP